ncbi:MAG: Hpt domain-containing protein [Pseudomonadota bacterium]
MSEKPVIDEEIHSSLRDVFDTEALGDLFQLYIEAVVSGQELLSEAVKTGDCALVEKEAHKIVSASAQYGFPRAAGVARALENAAIKEHTADFPRHLDQLTVVIADSQKIAEKIAIAGRH